MLSGMRTAAGTWLGKAILFVMFGFLIVSFAIWGIGDIFRGGVSTVVASVGRSDIGTEAFRRAFQNRIQEVQQQSRGFTTEQARQLGLDRQVLQQMLGEAALNEAGRRLGLGLSNEDVARTLAANPAFRGPDGRFNRQAFDAYIRNEQLSEAGFIQQQKQSMVRQHIVQGVSGGVATPTALLEMVHRYRAEERNLEYIVIPGAIAAAIPLPEESVLKALHEQRKSAFRAPEYRAFNLLAVLPQDFAGEVPVSEQEMQAGYDRMIAANRLGGSPERRQVQQLVFPNATEAAATAQKLKDGVPFEMILTELKLKPEDVDLGLKTKAELIDRAIADAAFALAEGASSEPVRGQFGLVVVRVSKIEPSTAPPLASVTDTVRADVVAQKIGSDRAVRDRVNQLHDKVEELRTGGRTLEQAAAELKIPLRKIAAADQRGADKGGQPADIPEPAEVLRAVFSSDRGVDNEAIKTRANGWIWFEVTGVERSRERNYDEVKDDVAASWRRDEANRQTQERANELLKKAEGGATLEDIANEAGVNVDTVEGVTRTGKEAISGSAAAIAFTLAENTWAVAPAAQGADRLLLRVTGRNVPTFDPAAADIAGLRRNLDQALASEIVDRYVSRLQTEIGATVNERSFATATGAQAAR
jgi:peptidyl-prolyl cis-trans isomerase D